MTDILTVTLNPALDVLTTIDRVSDTHKMRCGPTLKHPGGGGVNVARVLHRLGANCQAVYLGGGVTGERHRQLLRDEGVRCHVVPIAEETRESFSAHETSTGNDYRFVLPGPHVSEAEWQACLDYVAQHLPKKFLVLSGGLAPGVPEDFFARLAQLAKAHGVRVVLDSNGPALAEALKVGVYLFKPSLRELRDLTGQTLPDTDSQVAAARMLIDQGQAEMVAVSSGEDGAVLVSADESWQARSIHVKVKTTIGAGDSFVAAMVWALHGSHSLQTAFAYGMASGAASLLHEGTALSYPSDINLFVDLTIKKIERLTK
jgi:6-phosphofructokinase 2